MSRWERKAMVRRALPVLSLSRQCEILSVSRPGDIHRAMRTGRGQPLDRLVRRIGKRPRRARPVAKRAPMVSIYAVWYNWIRIHKTLRVTPAMADRL